MSTRKIQLTEHFDKFIDLGVASGQYGDASEIVCDALRLLEKAHKEDQAKLRLLRRAAREGFDAIDRGEGILVRGPEELKTFFDEIAAEVKAANDSKGRSRA